MIIIIRNADVYTPEHAGKTDVLLIGGKIAAVGDSIKVESHCQVLQLQELPQL